MFEWRRSLPVLVQEKDIEPFVLVAGHIHSHSVATQFEMHALILDIPDSIQTQTCGSFSKKHRPDGNTCGLGICF